MSTYNEQMQKSADRFMAETGCTVFTAKEVAAWAIKNHLWAPHPDLLVRQCADDFAKALREQYITDGQGRRVRQKHVALAALALPPFSPPRRPSVTAAGFLLGSGGSSFGIAPIAFWTTSYAIWLKSFGP